MAEERLLTISTFARAVGVPASALRHYSARGLLAPAEVDPFTGYRYYAPAQIADGVLVQRLRAAAVPVGTMREILAAAPEDRAALLDQQVAARSARSQALEGALAGALVSLRDGDHGEGPAPSPPVQVLGPTLAAALRQVLPAARFAAADVAGVVCEVDPEGLTLLTTDRYWLAQRRLLATGRAVPGAETRDRMRAILPVPAAEELAGRSARAGVLELRLVAGSLVVRDADGALVHEIPSAHRAVPDLGRLVATQPAARVLVGLPREALLAALTDAPAEGSVRRVRLDVGEEGARLRPADPPGGATGAGVAGWVAHQDPARPTGGSALSVLLQAPLLEAAARCCPGPEVLLAVVDEHTPAARAHRPAGLPDLPRHADAGLTFTLLEP